MAISAEIILISSFANRVNIARVTVVQLAAASALAFAAMPIAGERMSPPSLTFLLSATALGTASAAIQYLMNRAQRRVSATKATLIYAGEPVWARVVAASQGHRLDHANTLSAAATTQANTERNPLTSSGFSLGRFMPAMRW